jgi:hypothetical protein
MKTIKTILVGLLVLGVTLSIALHFFLPAAKLRALAQSEIRAKWHREAQIGDIGISLFGLSVERLRLSEKPNFAAGTFLYVENVRVRWSYLPLLRHQFALSDILLVEPQVNLVRMGDGKTLNISDLMESTHQPQALRTEATEVQWAAVGVQPSSTDHAAWSWYIQGIRLKEGTIRFEDRSPARQSTALNKINLTLKDFNATRMEGQLKISLIHNSFYQAQDLSIEWALTDLDPTLSHANGWAKLRQGAGRITDIPALISSGKSARTLFLPLMLLQNLNRSGLLRLGSFDLQRWTFQSISGDYEFDHGTLLIKNFTVASEQLGMQAQGRVQPVNGQLALDVHLQAPKSPLGNGALDVKFHISGTINHPITDMSSLKQQAFKAAVNGLLQSPKVRDQLDKTLQKLFH